MPKIRYDENNFPIFVTNQQVKKYCHHAAVVRDESEQEIIVKMNVSYQFLSEFNKFVANMLKESIHNARQMGRDKLVPEDIPQLIDG